MPFRYVVGSTFLEVLLQTCDISAPSNLYRKSSSKFPEAYLQKKISVEAYSRVGLASKFHSSIMFWIE